MSGARGAIIVTRVKRARGVKRDRVQPGMTGKFLPFKDEGAKGNEIAYGLKEE
jgi:hypothetical protein